MTIICGVDFTVAAREALVAAAAIAARTGERLVIVNVAQGPGAMDRVQAHELARARLRDAVTLAREMGCEAEGALRDGEPADTLRVAAARAEAWLLVIGRTAAERALGNLGETARRLLRRASCPWLEVATAEPWIGWARGARPLRVTVGSDLTPASNEAMAFVRKLQTIGPVVTQAAHIAWPPEAHHRTSVHGPMPFDALRPEVTEALSRELHQAAAIALGDTSAVVTVTHSFGRPEHELVHLAEDFAADVLLVGRRRKSWRQRIASPAVAAGVLRLAPMSTLLVPTGAFAEASPAEPS